MPPCPTWFVTSSLSHRKNRSIRKSAHWQMWKIRIRYGVPWHEACYCAPDAFRRAGSANTDGNVALIVVPPEWLSISR